MSPARRSTARRSTARRSTALFAALGLAVAAAPAAQAFPATDSLMPPPADCSVDVDQIAEDTPSSEAHPGWIAGEHGNLCGNLGYLLLETKQGTLTSPTKALLFHRGELVATQPADNTRVLLGNASDFHVELRFMQPPADDEANADADFLTTVYVWNPFAGDASPVGPLPAGLTS